MAVVTACGTGAPPAAESAPPRGFAHVFDYDKSAPLSASARLDTQNDVSRTEKIRFKGAGGQVVPALLMRPKTVKGRGPCVILGHPLTGSKEEAFGAQADGYAARGVTSFAIDARYHGERAGIGWEKAIAKPDTLYALYRNTVIDMRRGLDYLASRKVCDPRRLGYEGRSMGGFMGSMLIGADTRIRAAALYVSGANWRIYFSKTPSVLGGPLSGAKLNAAVRKMAPIDPLYWIPRAAGRPVLMSAGRLDDQTPLAAAQALHRAARQPKQIIIYNGGHDTEEPHATRVAKATSAFFKKYLRFRS